MANVRDALRQVAVPIHRVPSKVEMRINDDHMILISSRIARGRGPCGRPAQALRKILRRYIHQRINHSMLRSRMAWTNSSPVPRNGAAVCVKIPATSESFVTELEKYTASA